MDIQSSTSASGASNSVGDLTALVQQAKQRARAIRLENEGHSSVNGSSPIADQSKADLRTARALADRAASAGPQQTKAQQAAWAETQTRRPIDKRAHRAAVSTQPGGLVQTTGLRDEMVGNWGKAGIWATEMADVLFLSSGNPEIQPQDIKATIYNLVAETKEKYANTSETVQLRAAIKAVARVATAHGVSAQQIADAMVGEPGFSRSEVDEYFNSIKLMPPGMWQTLVDSSVVSTLRTELQGTGLDGSGVVVRIQEPSDTTHGTLVSLVVNDKSVGVAPGASIEMGFLSDLPSSQPTMTLEEEFWSEVDKTGLPKDDPQTLRLALGNMMSNSVAATFDGQTVAVNDIVAHSDARVVNMSYGASAAAFYKLAQRVIDAVPELKTVFPAVFDNPLEQFKFQQGVVDLTNNAMLSSPIVAQSYENYVNATRRAADNGKVLVIAAGNDQQAFDAAAGYGVVLPQWAAFNIFGASDYVISVGASNTQGTPANVADDTLTDFSAHGMDQFHPTVSTQGTQTAIPYATYLAWLQQPFSNIGGAGLMGTSFSAPIVSGAVALLLEQNPSRTFADIKAALQAAAVDTPAPTDAEGAGMLDLGRLVGV